MMKPTRTEAKADDSLLPSPASVGLPAKFDRWRKHQDAAVIALAASDNRFSGLVVPTGGGKSATYMAYANLSGAGRVAILTSTKSLQNQLQEFGKLDVRGKSNYPCEPDIVKDLRLDAETRVDEGPCQFGYTCSHKDNWIDVREEVEDKETGEIVTRLVKKLLPGDDACEYYFKVKQAKVVDVVVTNYAFWLSYNQNGKGLGEFDLLVLDEAHAAPDELAGFLSLTVQERDARYLLGMGLPTEAEDSWWKWIAEATRAIGRETLKLQGRPKTKEEIRKVLKLRALGKKLAQIVEIGKEAWVAERQPQSITWDISNPAPLAEKFLFRGTPRVIFSSATVRQKTLDLLGVEKDDSDMLEFPSTFAAARRPVYAVYNTPRMNFRTSPEEMDLWMSLIDQTLKMRQDRRGLIHSVSFKRAREIADHSEFEDAMVLHGSGSEELQRALGRYLSMKPAILVSPSVTTGVDLPGDAAEYCIIPKLPYPDMRSKVLKARMKADREYPAYIAAQTMVQATGRGMRSEDDLFESIILDGNFGWFMRNYAQFTPRWWRAAVKKVGVVPKPPRAIA